jgi:exoribonuclease-2
MTAHFCDGPVTLFEIGVTTEMLDEGLTRRDLTVLDFVTIDSASTEDMDDALYV